MSPTSREKAVGNPSLSHTTTVDIEQNTCIRMPMSWKWGQKCRSLHCKLHKNSIRWLFLEFLPLHSCFDLIEFFFSEKQTNRTISVNYNRYNFEYAQNEAFWRKREIVQYITLTDYGHVLKESFPNTRIRHFCLGFEKRKKNSIFRHASNLARIAFFWKIYLVKLCYFLNINKYIQYVFSRKLQEKNNFKSSEISFNFKFQMNGKWTLTSSEKRLAWSNGARCSK